MAHESDLKLGELILYISKKSAYDPHFGATKLNKILYFSDFIAYGRWGAAITDAEYQNLPKGPAPRRLIPVRDQLVKDGALAIQPVGLGTGYTQIRTVNLREPDLSVFRANDIALVDEVIEGLNSLNANNVSDLSHKLVGWKSTVVGDTINYATIFLSDEPLSEAEQKRARELSTEIAKV